jgi:5-methyltetrahydropteroyltriglutamate--homocysteine methyltransferase
MSRTLPPFRADQVGSLLRPAELLHARKQYGEGAITKAALRAIEDEAIRGVVRFQEQVGLQGITDGELRRTYFHIDFLEQLSGVETRGGMTVSFRKQDGSVDFAPPVMHVTNKVKHTHPIQVADFEFLKSVTTRTPKVTLPSPTMLHFRQGRLYVRAARRHEPRLPV